MTPTTRNSLAHGLITAATMVLVNTVWLYRWLEPHAGLVDWHPRSPLTWIAALVALDLVSYWGHRTAHRVRLLWAIHVVHHQSPDYTVATGVRSPALQIVLHAPWVALLALSGIPAVVMGPVYAFHQLYKLAVHTDRLPRMRGLDWILVTPAIHQVHHGVGLDQHNFAGMLSIWDRAFGTWRAPAEDPAPCGLNEPLVHDVVRNNLDPLRQLWADCSSERRG